MGLAPHEQRVVEEHAARKGELDRLLTFFENPIYDQLPEEDRELMLEQSRHMYGLVDVLGRRIARFGSQV